MSRILTADRVLAEFKAGRRQIEAPRGAVVVTPDAWTKATELGVTIVQAEAERAPEPPKYEKKRPVDKGSAERVVDPSGLVVVRGRSVRLGEFTGAGPDKHIGLTDVVTGQDRSPMTAGFMSWSREDSFAWSLDYDEIDLVLEGVLQITIAGRTLEGRSGDVFYIPKGSRIVFGTPSRTKVFYVTYPAEWQGAK